LYQPELFTNIYRKDAENAEIPQRDMAAIKYCGEDSSNRPETPKASDMSEPGA
jgi:hypothetical protein